MEAPFYHFSALSLSSPTFSVSSNNFLCKAFESTTFALVLEMHYQCTGAQHCIRGQTIYVIGILPLFFSNIFLVQINFSLTSWTCANWESTDYPPKPVNPICSWHQANSEVLEEWNLPEWYLIPYQGGSVYFKPRHHWTSPHQAHTLLHQKKTSGKSLCFEVILLG